ncbi:MAG TPA: threonine synthase [Steroidobacteraceae bacterium]|nr:threonine synthase [Steroidobacteraceae bacterium]
MRFASTHAPGQTVALTRALEHGLASDGGLYIPTALPQLDPAEAPSTHALPAVAHSLLEPFFSEDPLQASLAEIVAEAFNFPAPLTPLKGGAESAEVLELFHGPTAAFKDFGARFLAGCLARLPPNSTATTILVATSGDTGSAVAAAFHRKPGFEVVILYPKGLVSERQEQQLTCWDDNVRTVAITGTFDDCQRLVKRAFTDEALRRTHRLSSANSINIGRLLPQVTYHAAASLDVKRRTGEPASFIVPSGNLGNAVACVWARAMGMPIAEIVLAHNANRTVPDYFESGTWRPRASVATLASAMDVGDPSNAERLRSLYSDLEVMRHELAAVSISDEQIRTRIRADFSTYGRVWCPHTAVAAEAYAELPQELRRARHWVIVATAHPAKFNEIVEPLIGGAVAIPANLAALLALPRQVTELDADFDSFRAYLEQR